ncbi:MAG: DUF4340 domain-containing protein [Planctomycetes bacterium]|nr:DUF4340 domain-containing protein [Planctomycetota bacterium]
MNKSTLFALAVLVLVLGGLAWYVSDQEPTKKDDFEPGTLLALLGGEPDRIRMANKDGSKAYAFVRSERGWRLTDPVEDEASQSRMDMLLGQLGHAERMIGWPDRKPTPKDITDAGLDDPIGRLVLGARDKEVVIEFGAECFPVGFRFARVDGEVVRIPSGIEESVDANRDEWINSMLFLTSGIGLRRLELRRRGDDGASTGLIVERGTNNAFTVRSLQTDAEPLPADPARLTGILASVLSARAKRFLPKGGQAAPAPKPWMTIIVDGDHGREEVLLTSPVEGSVDAIKRYPATGDERPSRMIVDAMHFERFVTESIDDLISTQVWTYGPSSASRITIEVAQTGDASSPALVLGRTADEPFGIVSPKAGAADPRAVNALIVALERTKLVTMIASSDAAAQKALAVPRYRVRLEPPLAQPALGAFEVRFGVGDDGKIYAQRKAEGSPEDLVWIVDAAELEQLDRPWWHYVEPVAFRFGPSMKPVTGIAVRVGDKRIVFAPGDKGWGRRSDGPIELDENFEESIYEPLRELKSKEVVSGDANAWLAGLVPFATIEILQSQDGKDRVWQRIALFAQGEEGLVARRDDDPIVHRLFERTARTMRKFVDSLR